MGTRPTSNSGTYPTHNLSLAGSALGCTAVGQIVPIDRGDHHVRQAELGDGRRHVGFCLGRDLADDRIVVR